MRHEIFLYFDNGLPRTTAQEKGETVKYKFVNGKRWLMCITFANPRLKQREHSTHTS